MLKAVDCPYCGESYEAMVDISGGNQRYIEDCPVCCRPIELYLQVDINGEQVLLTAGRDDD